MRVNLAKIYEYLELLNEHVSSLNSQINFGSRKIINDWILWVHKQFLPPPPPKKEEKEGQTQAPTETPQKQPAPIPPKYAVFNGMDMKRKYDALFAFLIMIRQDMYVGMDDNALMAKYGFDGTVPVHGENCEFKIYPAQNKKYEGACFRHKNGHGYRIELYLSPRVLGDFFFAYTASAYSKDFEKENIAKTVENIKIQPDAYQRIYNAILGLQSTAAHELKHWFQNEWNLEETHIGYSYRDKFDAKTSVGRFWYIMTPHELDAQISSAYMFYRRHHKKVNFIDCLFQVFLFADADIEDIKDQSLEYSEYAQDEVDFFVFLYVVYVFIPYYSDKKWMKEVTKEALPGFEENWRVNGGPKVNPNVLESNAERIKEFTKEIVNDNEVLPFQEFLESFDSSYNDTGSTEESATQKFFCFWDSNERFINAVSEEYKAEVRRIRAATMKKTKKSKTSVHTVFPSDFRILLAHTDKDVAISFLDDAIQKHKESKSLDPLSTLYYCVVDKSHSSKTKTLEDTIKSDRKKHPIMVFVFYYIVYLYLVFNKPKKYYSIFEKSLKTHTLALQKKNLLMTDTDIFMIINRVKDIKEEFEEMNQPKAVNKYIKDNFKSTNDFFNQLLFPEGKNPLYKHIKKDVLNYIATGR